MRGAGKRVRVSGCILEPHWMGSVQNVNSIGRADVCFKCNGNALGRKYFSS